MTKSGVAKLTDFGLGRFLKVVDDEGALPLHRRQRSPMLQRFAARGEDQTPPGRRSRAENQTPPGGRPPQASKYRTATPEGSEEEESDETDTAHAPRPPHPLYSAVVGTAPYMAPEALQKTYDEKADIYSAAVTFYELMEQTPFDAELPFAWAVAPTRVRPLLRKMSNADPAQRPSALELIDLFGELAPGTSRSCTVS